MLYICLSELQKEYCNLQLFLFKVETKAGYTNNDDVKTFENHFWNALCGNFNHNFFFIKEQSKFINFNKNNTRSIHSLALYAAFCMKKSLLLLFLFVNNSLNDNLLLNNLNQIRAINNAGVVSFFFFFEK